MSIEKIISEFDKEFEIIGEVQFGQSFPCEGGYCGTSVSKIKDFITKAYQSGREDEGEEIRKIIKQQLIESNHFRSLASMKSEENFRDGILFGQRQILSILTNNKDE